ncbi:hypothetical protein P4204_09510 [Pseudomonas aeruginosa]|nr:hypothetical protein [Pseudomonas aeruginosa]
MRRLKKYGYWIWLIAVLGIPLSYWWSLGSDYPNAWPWLVISVVFGLIPILDTIVGRDPANPEEASEVPEMEAQGYYRVLSWPPSRCCWACSSGPAGSSPTRPAGTGSANWAGSCRWAP